MTDDRKRTDDPSEPQGVTEEVYNPPSGAEETDRVDASVDGTSASHYGTNDPEHLDKSDE